MVSAPGGLSWPQGLPFPGQEFSPFSYKPLECCGSVSLLPLLLGGTESCPLSTLLPCPLCPQWPRWPCRRTPAHGPFCLPTGPMADPISLLHALQLWALPLPGPPQVTSPCKLTSCLLQEASAFRSSGWTALSMGLSRAHVPGGQPLPQRAAGVLWGCARLRAVCSGDPAQDEPLPGSWRVTDRGVPGGSPRPVHLWSVPLCFGPLAGVLSLDGTAQHGDSQPRTSSRRIPAAHPTLSPS